MNKKNSRILYKKLQSKRPPFLWDRNLIDISSIKMLDRLQYEYALERASEYSTLLQGIQEQKGPLDTVPIQSVPTEPFGPCLSCISQNQCREWAAQIQESEIQVQKFSFVVPLHH